MDLLSLSAALRENSPPPEEPSVPLVGHTGAFYTVEQREKLEEYYCTNIPTGNHSFMTRKDIQKNLQALSRATGLSKDQIRMWLRNRKKRGAYKGKTVHDTLQIRGLEWVYTTYSKYPSGRFKRRLALMLGKDFTFCFFFVFLLLFVFWGRGGRLVDTTFLLFLFFFLPKGLPLDFVLLDFCFFFSLPIPKKLLFGHNPFT